MDWVHEAACLEHDPEIFFPSGTTGPAWQELERAKAICRQCPVRVHCLQWALDTGQDSGVWGGLSEHERRRGSRRRMVIPTGRDR